MGRPAHYFADDESMPGFFGIAILPLEYDAQGEHEAVSEIAQHGLIRPSPCIVLASGYPRLEYFGPLYE